MKKRKQPKIGYQQVNIAVPGYVVTPVNAHEGLDESNESALMFTTQRLLAFVRERDAVALLAKTGIQFLIENALSDKPGTRALTIEQAHVELLQMFVLTAGAGKAVPTSPHNMIRVWALLKQNLAAYRESLEPKKEDMTATQAVADRARLHTLYYRNIFNSDEAAEIVPALLGIMDSVSVQQLGYALSDFAVALFTIFNAVSERLEGYHQRINVLLNPNGAVDTEIAAICRDSAVADRAWRYAEHRFTTRAELGMAGFQLSELACAPIFTFERLELEERFSPIVVSKLYDCAIPLGTFAEASLMQVYLDNPIWRRPFILLEDGRLFLPIPSLIVSFPFLIVERLIGDNQRLLTAYSDARSKYLEQAIEVIIRQAMPSAGVFTSVRWKDPETNEDWEHDVVAVLGNQLFVFEAKSGKLSSASRRGGTGSLIKNFKDLFIEPGRQASRLERLLGRREAVAGILKDKKGNAIDLDLSTPYVVHKFAVCIEHFPGMTTSRRHFADLDLLECESDWAPILSLGELRMIATFLDTEVSFFHYLTRRSTIEDMITFDGDEQDLLSMYLTNGFCIDAEKVSGHHIIFKNADAPVRGRKQARSDRTKVDTLGIRLPPKWRLIAEEIYMSENRGRFAMLEVIMNQPPPALAEMARRILRWKSGGGKKSDLVYIHYAVGRRVFVLAFTLLKNPPLDNRDWLDGSREIARGLVAKTGCTDCVVLCATRRSPSLTYDGISFFRFQPGSGG